MRVEIAHLYSNELWTTRHEESINILKKKYPEITSASILIDNYHAKGVVNEVRVKDEMKNRGLIVSVFYEEEMVNKTSEFNLPLRVTKKGSFFKQYRVKNSDGKYSCNYLTALWYLTQSGFFDGERVEFLIIIPKMYEKNEAKSLDLMEALVPGRKGLIKHLFY